MLCGTQNAITGFQYNSFTERGQKKQKGRRAEKLWDKETRGAEHAQDRHTIGSTPTGKNNSKRHNYNTAWLQR